MCKNLSDMDPNDPRYDKSQPTCATLSEINEFIRDIEVQSYVVEPNIYWETYFVKPVYYRMRQISSQLLNKNYFYRKFNYLRKNEIKTDDYFFSFGE